jgi:2-iminobutanoate/2-iminopropanoate deaminase
VKATVLLKNMGDFNDVNEVYKEFFKTNEPARAAYEVAALPKGAMVEIEAVAVIGDIVDEKI